MIQSPDLLQTCLKGGCTRALGSGRSPKKQAAEFFRWESPLSGRNFAEIWATFGFSSGWVIYQDQLEAFRQIKRKPYSPAVIRKETSELLLDLVMTALPVGVLVTGFGIGWITRKALRPLQDVADAAEQIHAHSLSQRLARPQDDDEIGRLVHVLNDAFDRRERSFALAKRFSSDAEFYSTCTADHSHYCGFPTQEWKFPIKHVDRIFERF